jgi:hypothetical protein
MQCTKYHDFFLNVYAFSVVTVKRENGTPNCVDFASTSNNVSVQKNPRKVKCSAFLSKAHFQLIMHCGVESL